MTVDNGQPPPNPIMSPEWLRFGHSNDLEMHKKARIFFNISIHNFLGTKISMCLPLTYMDLLGLGERQDCFLVPISLTFQTLTLSMNQHQLYFALWRNSSVSAVVLETVLISFPVPEHVFDCLGIKGPYF